MKAQSVDEICKPFIDFTLGYLNKGVLPMSFLYGKYRKSPSLIVVANMDENENKPAIVKAVTNRLREDDADYVITACEARKLQLPRSKGIEFMKKPVKLSERPDAIDIIHIIYQNREGFIKSYDYPVTGEIPKRKLGKPVITDNSTPEIAHLGIMIFSW